MYDELTKQDLKEMQDEVDYRTAVLRPKLLEDVKTARAFGDLSENYEYKAAKLEKNRNDSRIRYLQKMINTAVILEDKSDCNSVGVGDKVTVYIEEDNEDATYTIVTTVRQDALNDIISKDSPVGKALMGGKVGDRIEIRVNAEYSYFVQIKNIEKNAGNDIPLTKY